MFKFSITIPYYNEAGHTQKLAEHIAEGANSCKQIHCQIMNIQQMTHNECNLLYKSDGIIFGSPPYLGTVAAEFKTFMEKTSSFRVEQKWQDKIATAFTIGSCPSGDKLNTLITLNSFAMEHGMICVGLNEVGSRFYQ